MEYKFEPIKFGIMKSGLNPGISFDAIIYCKCDRFYGLSLHFTFQTFKKSYFLNIKPFGQVRFNE